MIPIILDTDPGIDDAAAIILALKNKQIDLKLITTVVGNVNIEHTTNNALKLMQFMNADVPVAKGAYTPLIRDYEDASYAHGETGMGGYDFPELTRKPLPIHAVEAMRKTLEESEEKITIVAIGALTNLAMLIKMYPQSLKNIKEIVIMGGGLSLGNTQSASEFNIYADPHAAKIVFDAGLPLTMIGLDVTCKTLLSTDVVDKIRDANREGNMLYNIFKHYRAVAVTTGLRMHDACVIYYLIHRDKTVTKDYYVDIALDGPAQGATVADIRGAYHEGTNCTVGLEFDVKHFNQWFLDEISA